MWNQKKKCLNIFILALPTLTTSRLQRRPEMSSVTCCACTRSNMRNWSSLYFVWYAFFFILITYAANTTQRWITRDSDFRANQLFVEFITRPMTLMVLMRTRRWSLDLVMQAKLSTKEILTLMASWTLLQTLYGTFFYNEDTNFGNSWTLQFTK